MKDKNKLANGFSIDYHIKDELSEMLDRYTPQQIKEIMESVAPKLNSKNFKTPVVFGTVGEIPEFKEYGLTWFNWWKEEPTFKKFDDE